MLSNKILLLLSVLLLVPLQLLSQSITLRDTTNQYDYIIITVPEFVSACESFRQHKETVRDFRTLIVDTTQIFAEFDSSSTPEDNIRNFISYAGTFWREPYPKYFLLVGNVQAIPNFQISYSPTFELAHTDYSYSQNIYDIDTTTTDFYIGRVPAITINEIENYFSKVIGNEIDPGLYNWMNNNLFICEDDVLFGFLDEALYISDKLPDYINSSFITDDSSSVYFGNKDSIYQIINNKGFSAVSFVGHCSDSAFISEDYFNLTDLIGFQNFSQYFVTFFITTQHSIIDSNTNLTKEMMLMENSGSLGGTVFTGTVFWYPVRNYHRIFISRLFDPDFNSLGEAYDINLQIPGYIGYYTQRITNLWADPSLQLKYDPTVEVDEITNVIPSEYFLDQNYPNPFNPKTSIRFQLMNRGFVTLKVFNVLGKEVETLINEEKSAGNYEVEFDASDLSSGIYIYRLQAGNFNQTRKMILLK